jgi:ABC-type phosphate/phosphonate transport system substrate-binding protein
MKRCDQTSREQLTQRIVGQPISKLNIHMTHSSAEWIATLPMYDFPELTQAHDELWRALAHHLSNAGVREPPRRLTRTVGHFESWAHPHLLLGQGCEYPLAKSFANRILPVATPRYSVPGCEGNRYRSAIVVRHDDPAETLADLRGRRCVINEPNSNSGMNLLRAAIAPLSGGSRFFESVAVSGAHIRSAEMVARGQADIAALDCVSFAHFRRLYPSIVENLRVLCWTPSSPSLPFITARTTDAPTLQALRSALTAVTTDSAFTRIRDELYLDSIDIEPDPNFAEVLLLERRATDLGYPAVL